LNRAPTLHRLGIQAFEPLLVEGKAIQIHPLVCAAFNADFDGDQMAVHIPLSVEAQIEAQTLMLSTNNILSPAHGRPLTIPSQDMVLGCYYLTLEKRGQKGEGRTFGSPDEVLLAMESGEVELQSEIKLRFSGPFMNLATFYDDQAVMTCPINEVSGEHVETTPGRIIFNSALPEGMPFINGIFRKKGLENLVFYGYLRKGLKPTVEMLDSLKDLGFKYATKAGFSLGIDDFVIPGEKAALVDKAQKEVTGIESLYREGTISAGERFNRVIEIWGTVTDKVSAAMIGEMKRISFEGRGLNPLFVMADSGSRGNKQQIRQLAGMRGLMSKPSGEILETPITSNLREGLNVLQYFISTHGARKGLADTALKTANSGYLTRKLVDVSQEVIVDEHDCGTLKGINVTAIVENGEIIEPFIDRIVGRTSIELVVNPDTGEVVVDMNEEVTEAVAQQFQNLGIERVKIRSVLTCESSRGVCRFCYGRDLATGKLVEIGQAVGVIAAQSIGEPGTQLTMRTFHIGGTASQVHEASFAEARSEGTVKYLAVTVVRNRAGLNIVMGRQGNVLVMDTRGRELERHAVSYGAVLKVEDGQRVKPGELLLEWDPYTFQILTEEAGVVEFQDVVENITVREEQDEVTGLIQKVIIRSKDETRVPKVVVRRGKERVRSYLLPEKALLSVEDGQEVAPGDTLARIPRETTKTKDITGGLPRVVELFEARAPKEPAVISEIDGTVEYDESAERVKGFIPVYVVSDDGDRREYKIPKGKHITVRKGEHLRAGDALMDGPKDPHDILRVLGENALQEYLVNEIQEVYRLQGVDINDKHVETIVRHMMRWVQIEEVGDTEFVLEDRVDRFRFRRENERVISEGGQPAMGRPLLLGITKASLLSESFVSAASFQETTRVLTEAAIRGATDILGGLKENVIMGRLIPAGTGAHPYRDYEMPAMVREQAEPEEEAAQLETAPDDSILLQVLGRELAGGGAAPLPKA
ncbi:DNA-directed RNA polymerase subunit beta', partial [bacterium]|nr:DNA-directed RNA polymerase subunit beta' [bacterium]